MAVIPSIRPAVPPDLPALSAIEAEAFSDAPWPADSFLAYDCIVAEVDGEIAGFLVSRDVVPPEREILNIAVAKRFRRSGIASALLRFELKPGTIFFLEVRESNHAAQTLYRQFGFTEIARRRDYYQNPPETAIVMRSK